jgi:hypothetical protein
MADRDLLDRGGLNAIEPGLTGAARVTIGGKSRKTRGCVVAARRAPTPTTQGPPTGPGTAETEHAATLNTIHQEPARVRPVAVHPGGAVTRRPAHEMGQWSLHSRNGYSASARPGREPGSAGSGQ